MTQDKAIQEGVGLGAAIALGGAFGLVTLGCWLFLGSSSAAVFVLGGVTVLLVAVCLAFDMTIYRDRMVLGRWPFRRRIVIFSQCTEATVRADRGGRPELAFRDGRGRRHRVALSSGSQGQHHVESRIRLLVALLQANGVPVESRNVLGNGPYTAWQVPEPDLGA